MPSRSPHSAFLSFRAKPALSNAVSRVCTSAVPLHFGLDILPLPGGLEGPAFLPFCPGNQEFRASQAANVSVVPLPAGEEDPSVEEDEEVLTLLYDPCLNCYFDPQTGKYYELV